MVGKFLTLIGPVNVLHLVESAIRLTRIRKRINESTICLAHSRILFRY